MLAQHQLLRIKKQKETHIHLEHFDPKQNFMELRTRKLPCDDFLIVFVASLPACVDLRSFSFCFCAISDPSYTRRHSDAQDKGEKICF
jgi:hypothetical protein